MNETKVLSLLGLAMKAGKAESGEYAVEKAVREKRALLVIVTEDASFNTKKKFRNMCSWHRIPFYIFSTKEQLGHAIGKEFRASLAVTDENLGNAAVKKLDELQEGRKGGKAIE